jgi:hypothetical protein
MSRNILGHIKEFSFIHMLFFFLSGAQASTALPARYRRLGFEFATASPKKITFATSSAEDLGIYHIYDLITFLEQIRAFSKFPVSFD